MGHTLRTKRYSGALALTLALPCSKEAFDAFAKEAKKEKNEKGETIVNHDAQIAFVFKRNGVALVKADGVKMVVYEDAYIGAHDVFGLTVPDFGNDISQASGEWVGTSLGSDVDEGGTDSRTA